MVEALIDTRLRASLQFHGVLHMLWDGRGMGMDITELKISQNLARVDNKPLFLVLLDLRKAYDTVYRDRLIHNLEGYGAGPRLCGFLETF